MKTEVVKPKMHGGQEITVMIGYDCFKNTTSLGFCTKFHSVNQTFLAENVRSNKEMGSYLANVVGFSADN